jgi:dihydrofolate reductase
MGRKTYDSVPVSLRPLAKRISVVVTRDTSGAVKEGVLGELAGRRERIAHKAKAAEAVEKVGEVEEKVEPVTDAIVVPSLEQALERLDVEYGEKGVLGKVFVIGGAEIYNAAIGLQAKDGLKGRPLRVVMTNVVRRGADGAVGSFECDTFFPIDGFEGWRAASSAEVSEWVGEEVDGVWKSEGDVEVQMVGFEKV